MEPELVERARKRARYLAQKVTPIFKMLGRFLPLANRPPTEDEVVSAYMRLIDDVASNIAHPIAGITTYRSRHSWLVVAASPMQNQQPLPHGRWMIEVSFEITEQVHNLEK